MASEPERFSFPHVLSAKRFVDARTDQGSFVHSFVVLLLPLPLARLRLLCPHERREEKKKCGAEFQSLLPLFDLGNSKTPIRASRNGDIGDDP